MIHLYVNALGEFVSADKLTPEDALDNFLNGKLLAVDLGRLTVEAAKAIAPLMPRPKRNGVMLFAGVVRRNAA